MKKRRLFSLFLSFALLLPLFSLTSADAYEDFTLDAKAFSLRPTRAKFSTRKTPIRRTSPRRSQR